MKIAAFAWVLVIGFGFPYGFSVSGIASNDACQRLGKELNVDQFFPVSFKCIRYERATP